MHRSGLNHKGRGTTRVTLLAALTVVLAVGLVAAVVASTVTRRATDFDITEQGPAVENGSQSAYRAENPANNLRLSFSVAGLTATPKGTGTPAWRLELGLPEVAFDGQPGPRAKVRLLAAANRIDYDSGAVTQSFVNSEAGLEQSIKIVAPPSAQPETVRSESVPTTLTLDLAVAGDLSPSHPKGGYFVDLVTAKGDTVLRWGAVRVNDANGTVLPVRFEVRAPGEETGSGGVRVIIDAINPAYPVEVLAVLTSVGVAGPTPAPEPGDGSGEIVGVPVTLGQGVTESVAEIMARERLTPPVMLARPREKYPEFDADLNLQEDPNAPAAFISQPSVPWTPETQAPLLGPPSLPQTVGTSFQGVNISEAPFIPPDSMGAVGPTQILVHVNGRIKTFTKAGALDGALNATDDTFWASVAPGIPPGTNAGISDPEVRYDRLSGRWILDAITIAEAVNNKIVLAVSSGPTITSQASFTFYSFAVGTPAPADATSFCDYQSLGIDANAIYTGCNMFTSAGVFRWTSAFVIRKSSVLSGGPMVVTGFNQIADNSPAIAGPYSPRGVDNDDPTWTEGYIIGTDPGFTNRINIRRVSTPGGTPTLGANVTLAITSTNMTAQRASGSTTQIDVSDIRLFMASIHRNKLTGVTSLWTAHSVETTTACVASSDVLVTTRRIGARWYEIGTLTTTPTITQQGTLCNTATGADLLNSERGFMYPTVTETGQGHMALSASYAATAEFVGVAAAGRLRTDASGGTRAPETIVQPGLAAYTLNDTGGRNRWGDYSFTQVDPTDDQTVWTFQEYADLTSTCPYGSCWSLRAVQLVAPAPPALASATAVCTGLASTTSTITGTDSCAAPTCTNGLCTGGGACPEFFDPGADTGGPGYANHITASVTGGVTVNPFPSTNIVIPGSPSTSRVLQATLSLNTTAAAAGTRTITITNPDGQSITSASAILTVNQTPTAPTASNAGPICAGATLNLAASTVGGATYSWTGPNGFSSALQNPTILNATTAATGIYSVTATVNGCPSSAGTTAATVTGTGGACGSQTSTTCDAPDTCGAGGVCQPNFATGGTACGVAGSACKNQDTCNGSGSCIDNGFKSAATLCTGASQGGGCDNDTVDHCTGTSNSCVDVFRASGFTCRTSAGQCDVAETCTGTSGACPADGFQTSGTACGNASSGSCDNADTCDGAGTCQANNVADGTFCGDAGTSCTNQDKCLSGVCNDNGFKAFGTACGDPSSGACDNADTCDGSGSCLVNHVADSTSCDDANVCTTGTVCGSGVCGGGTVILPAEVNDSVRLDAAGTTVSWTDPPGLYSVYRGTRSNGILWAYNQTCFDPHTGVSSTTDAANPPVDTTFFYLVTRDDACGESILGRDSDGLPRPNLAPCP